MVDWLCFPRFDSPAVFCSLLDEDGGHWRLGVVGLVEVSRRYLDRTLVVETTQRTNSGTVVVTDALAVGSGERGHQLGAGSPHALLRRVVCTDGEAEVECEFLRRPEYGLARPLLRSEDGGVVTQGSPDALALATSVPLQVEGGVARAGFKLRGGVSRRPSPCSGRAPGSSPHACGNPRRWQSACRTPSMRGGPGRSSTSTTRGRGVSWSTSADGCCRG